MGLARGGRPSPVRRGIRHLGRLGSPAQRRLIATWTAPLKRPTPRSTSGCPTRIYRSGSDLPAHRPTAPQTAKIGDPAPTPAIPVPIGSVLLARVSGGSGTPALTANGAASSAFEQVDQVSYQITQPVTNGGTIAVEQDGRTLGSWPITVVPDTAPIIALPTPPAPGERGALRLEYEARDDYGVVTRHRHRPPERRRGGTGHRPHPGRASASLPGVRPRTARSTSFHDLTPHPWAGLR